MLGPSGCGKTTTLRMIAGFEEPDSGRILLDGEDVTWVSPKKRNVNMVFQDYALFPHMTVAENVAFGLKLQAGRPRARSTRGSPRCSPSCRLEGYEDRRPAELSGGQRQRVALARALVNRPAALLLDEPLGALDLKLRREMQLELKRIQQSTGTTFVYVTHDQEEALTMSDRIAVMDGGKVEQVDEPQALYERPATAFVADFIGTSNTSRSPATAVTTGLVVMDLGEGMRIVAPDSRQRRPTAGSPCARRRSASAPREAASGSRVPGHGRRAGLPRLALADRRRDPHGRAPDRPRAQRRRAARRPSPGESVVLSWHARAQPRDRPAEPLA